MRVPNHRGTALRRALAWSDKIDPSYSEFPKTSLEVSMKTCLFAVFVLLAAVVRCRHALSSNQQPSG